MLLTCVATEDYHCVDPTAVPELYIGLQVVSDHHKSTQICLHQPRVLSPNDIEDLRIRLPHQNGLLIIVALRSNGLHYGATSWALPGWIQTRKHSVRIRCYKGCIIDLDVE